ncbi:hypothetical protein PUNSTDRAFT_42835 [Punctularia strigosozonata HHB-11173 SS5]|uniref:uncharacterized protein n=1 Tax=Punctularia strigosozonata (strain HHB-11173) TaxID=741275 RepID=UPI0004416576|nr:uncharacterized protein PUNSTDRAFT_42835 [Punctularia strigosozonata HHB-11173 SS5]EIN11634.1 hypothetical protein PUNSTDRAFT_42835 [Punctularia strigosozonata HHB-11173 SS5]
MEEQGEQINEESYGHLIDRSCQARNLEMCLRLCAEAESRGLVPTLPAVEATIRLAAELGYARLAIELAEDFETKSVRRISPATWIACLESSAEALYKEGVAECWHKVVTEFHITPHEGVCLAVLHTAARHGIPALANDVLKQLTTLQVPLQEYHLAPVLEAFAAEGELKAAFGVLSMMRSIGATPTLQTTTTVQNLVAKDADAVDRAWTALEEIHAGGEPVDVVALNTVLECCSRLQDLQRAIGIYKAAKDLGVEPDVTTYNILFAACTHLKHRELGDKLLEEMRAADIQPNHDTYHRFILLCLTQHNYEDAFFYLEEMKKAGFKPPMDVYQSIIRKCVAHKDSRYNIAVEEMVECGYPLTQALQDYIDSGGKPTKTTAHQETAPEEEEEETNHASIEEKASQFMADLAEADRAPQRRATASS